MKTRRLSDDAFIKRVSDTAQGIVRHLGEVLKPQEDLTDREKIAVSILSTVFASTTMFHKSNVPASQAVKLFLEYLATAYGAKMHSFASEIDSPAQEPKVLVH